MRALLSVNTAGLPRVGEAGAFVSLDWRVVAFTMAVVDRHGHPLRPDARRFRARAPICTTSLKEASGRSGTGFRQNNARSALVRRRGRAGADSARRLRAAHPHVARARARRSRLRRRQRADDADVADGTAVPRQSEAVDATGARMASSGCSAIPGVELASATCCVPLQGGYGLPFIIFGRPLDRTVRSTAAAPG